MGAIDVRVAWTWSVIGEQPGFRGFEVVDSDGDGLGELFVAPLRPFAWYKVESEGGTLRQSMSSFHVEGEVMAMDVSPGEPAVVAILTREEIFVFNALSGEEIANYPVGSFYNDSIAVADLDGDGALEAIVCDNYDLFRYELLAGTETAVKFGFGCDDIAIGQTDFDPALEIAIAGNPSGGYLLDGVTLAVEWGDVSGFGDRVALGDVDADGLDEVVAASGYSTYGVWAMDPQSGELLWEAIAYSPVALAVGDVDGQSGEEVVWADDSWGGVKVLAGATGQLVNEIGPFSSDVMALAIGDATGDGVGEIFWSGGQCCGAGGEIYAAYADSEEAYSRLFGPEFPIGGAAVGDFEGTGETQVAIVGHMIGGTSQSGIAVHSLDSGRRLRVSGEAGLPLVPAKGEIACAQLDTDAPLELCVAKTDSWNGRTACLDGASFETQWETSLNQTPKSIVLAETDGDTFPELFAATDQSRATAQEADSGWLKWQTPPPPPETYGFDEIEIVDSDSDGEAEAVAFRFDYSPSSNNVVVYSATSGAVIGGPWEIPLTAVATLPVSSGLSNSLFIADDEGTIRGIDALTGWIGPAIADFPGEVRRFVLAEVTRDEVIDVVAVGDDGKIRLWDGQAAALAWTGPNLGSVRTLEAGDLDHDTIPEIVTATYYGVAVFVSGVVDLLIDGFESGGLDAWSASFP